MRPSLLSASKSLRSLFLIESEVLKPYKKSKSKRSMSSSNANKKAYNSVLDESGKLSEVKCQKKYKRIKQSSAGFLDKLPTQDVAGAGSGIQPDMKETELEIRQPTDKSCEGLKRFRWNNDDPLLLDLDPEEYLDFVFWKEEEKKRNRWTPSDEDPSKMKFQASSSKEKLAMKVRHIRRRWPLTAKVTKGMEYTRNPNRLLYLAGQTVKVFLRFDANFFKTRNRPISKNSTDPGMIQKLLKKMKEKNQTKFVSDGQNNENDGADDGEDSSSSTQEKISEAQSEDEQTNEEENSNQYYESGQRNEDDTSSSEEHLEDEETQSDRDFIDDRVVESFTEESDEEADRYVSEKNKKPLKRKLNVVDSDGESDVESDAISKKSKSIVEQESKGENDITTSRHITEPSVSRSFLLKNTNFCKESIFPAYFPTNWELKAQEKLPHFNWRKKPLIPSFEQLREQMNDYHNDRTGHVIGSLKIHTWNPKNIARYGCKNDSVHREVVIYQGGSHKQGQAINIPSRDLHKVMQALAHENNEITRSEINERHLNDTRRINKEILDLTSDQLSLRRQIESANNQKRLHALQSKLLNNQSNIRILMSKLKLENEKHEEALRIVDFNEGATQVIIQLDGTVIARIDEREDTIQPLT